MRDNFDPQTKLVLSQRVGNRCANPNCRQLTSGPQIDPTKATNIGVAAHICAAAKGGKRYKPHMSSEERKAIENGIWLCQNCAKLIDNDELHYMEDLICEWRNLSERSARLELEKPQLKVLENSDDKELIQFYSQCFDRPAFQDEFRQEASTEAFDKAIEDTITAINTGTLRSRDGVILARSKGKSFLLNTAWRDQMDVVVDVLRSMRSRYRLGIQLGEIWVGSGNEENRTYCINDQTIVNFFDLNRHEVIQLFSKICREAGVSELQFPRSWRKNRFN